MKKNVKQTNPIILDGFALTISDVIRIATKSNNGNYAQVIPAKSALRAVQACAEFIRKKAESGEVIYGVTTGFGSRADTAIEIDHAKELQENLLRSHATGVGEPLPVTVVRAMMVIRLNTLLQGHSGVQVKTVELLRDLLNNEIHPVVPSQGSVGASGDLCPLSHLALPLIGEGEVTIGDDMTIFPARIGLKRKKLQPIQLSYKEGIALNNGTALMTALGALAVHETKQLLQLATLSSALIFEALCARSDSYAYEPIHSVRKHDGQIHIAKWLRTLLQGSSHIDIQQSDILACITEHNKSESPWKDMQKFAEKKFKPQDAYSIRCVPQVFGAAYAALKHVEETVSNELNAAVDNPLIFLKGLHGVAWDRVVSGGNFHGEPIGMPLDYLKLAVAEIGSIVERQINKLVDSNTNDGLPSFLVNGSGLNSGLMIAQYVAASLVSENKVLVHPATADSIPTCENTEDHVSMGPIAGRQALEIIENVKKVVAIAILTGYQGVAMRKEQFSKCNIRLGKKKTPPRLAPATAKFYHEIEGCLGKFKHGKDWLSKDRYLSPEIGEILRAFPRFYEFVGKYLG